MSPGDTVSPRLGIRAEFERMANGRWVATIPGVPETRVVGYGWSRHEAAVGLTVRALHIMADRFQRGELEVKDEPAGIIDLADSLSAMLTEFAGSHTPNAETIAAIEELESGGGERCDTAFNRDYKKLKLGGRHDIDSVLPHVVAMLRRDDPLDSIWRDHALCGEWKDYRECNLCPDLLLIYQKSGSFLLLVRLGSRSELF
jgi:mRNA interferase YafQ